MALVLGSDGEAHLGLAKIIRLRPGRAAKIIRLRPGRAGSSSQSP
jgi:hypothetical protein